MGKTSNSLIREESAFRAILIDWKSLIVLNDTAFFSSARFKIGLLSLNQESLPFRQSTIPLIDQLPWRKSNDQPLDLLRGFFFFSLSLSLSRSPHLHLSLSLSPSLSPSLCPPLSVSLSLSLYRSPTPSLSVNLSISLFSVKHQLRASPSETLSPTHPPPPTLNP